MQGQKADLNQDRIDGIINRMSSGELYADVAWLLDDYPDVSQDGYRRHKTCRCAVEYVPGKGKRQDVWSKKWRAPEESIKIEARKKIKTK